MQREGLWQPPLAQVDQRAPRKRLRGHVQAVPPGPPGRVHLLAAGMRAPLHRAAARCAAASDGAGLCGVAQDTGARLTNYGTRIDYILVSADLAPCVALADVWPHVRGSDHCPVVAVLNFPVRSERARDAAPPLCARYMSEFSKTQSSLRQFLQRQPSHRRARARREVRSRGSRRRRPDGRRTAADAQAASERQQPASEAPGACASLLAYLRRSLRGRRRRAQSRGGWRGRRGRG